VVKKINTEPPYLSRIGHFLENTHLDNGYFRSVRFISIPRNCNSAAHYLAKEASNNIVDLCWSEETPMSVSNIVLREQSCP